MPRTIGNLTPLRIEKARAAGVYADGGGLYLQVTGKAGRSWLFRYRLRGKSHEMGLGSLKAVKLAAARKLAADCRELLAAGIDPIARRDTERAQAALEAAKAIMFKACAQRHVEAHRAAWRNPKHAKQWESTLETYAYPMIGALGVGAITTELVVRVLQQPVSLRGRKGIAPLWTARPETASRLRGRIEAVLSYATAHGYRVGENPARWRGHLDKLLPARSKVRAVKHHAALPYDELPAFMAELRKKNGVSARALEFTILTAARTGAVIGATWDEINLTRKVWTVPPERAGTKIGGEDPKPRRVPLCDRAVAILQSAPRRDGNPHLFIGNSERGGLSNMAMLELLRDMRPGVTAHGFRSTFKDWAAEVTHYSNEVSEAVLWHAVADKVEAAYRRGDLFEKRRLMMEAWERYCYVQRAVGDVVALA